MSVCGIFAWFWYQGDSGLTNEFGKVVDFLSHQALLDIDDFLFGNFGGLAHLAVT